ncbi:hypothetical protein Tco_0650713 [Tanacetum coccineum]
MTREDDQNINNQPPNPPPPTQQSPHTISTIKLPILKKGEYDIWAMKMEHYLAHTDYPVWEVIQNGNGPVSLSTDIQGLESSKMCDKKNKVLFTDSECLVLSPEFKLLRINQDYLESPTKHMYSINQEKTLFPLEIKNSKLNKHVGPQEANHNAGTEDNINAGDSEIKAESAQDYFILLIWSSYTSIVKSTKAKDAETFAKLKRKNDLKAKVEKWHNSSKNLNIVLNSQMSARDKAGLGYGDQLNKGVLSYENEVFQSVFVSRTSETENNPMNDRYAEGMHVVPPLMIGIYIPSGPDKEIDDSHFTYDPKQFKPSESNARSSDFNSCESNCIEEEHMESMPEPFYELDSEDEQVSLPTKEQEIPSFAFIDTDKHVKTHRQTIIEQNTCSQSPKPDKKDCSGLMSKKLGFGFGYTKKACFVCGGFSHLIRDCDFHKKMMAKQAELNNRMSRGSSQREIRPVWNNVQRMNHQNQFVPKAVLTKTGKIPVNTARTSGTNTVNTARHNFKRQAVPINTARHNFNRQFLGMEIEIGLPTLNEVSRKLMMFGSMIGVRYYVCVLKTASIKSSG